MKNNEVFSIAEENKMVPGCTLSKKFYEENGYVFMHFSLAPHTSISAETYSTYKVVIMVKGSMDVFTKVHTVSLGEGELIVLPINIPVGMRSEEGAIYTELTLRADSKIALAAFEVYAVNDLSAGQKLADDPLFSLQAIDLKGEMTIAKQSLLYIFAGAGYADGKPIRNGENYLGKDYVLKGDPHLKGLLAVKEK